MTSIADFIAATRGVHNVAGVGAAGRGLEDGARQRIGDVIADVLAHAHAGHSAQHIYTRILDSPARRAVESLSARRRAPLLGVPVAIKDNIDVAGEFTSCGRRLRMGRAVTNAAIVERLGSLGAICIGKTNLDEAALGASGRNPRFGRCQNPRFPDRLSGGSSSGAAAAVAAGQALLGVGTDTLGSVRIPAAFCGIVGFKPSHGRLPMAGVAPLYPRFDTVGLLAGSLADIAQVAGSLLGHDAPHGGVLCPDPFEPMMARTSPALTSRLPPNRALEVSVLDERALTDVADDVATGYRRCLALLQGLHEFHGGPAPRIDWTAAARAALWEVAHDFAQRSAVRTAGYHALDDIDGDLGRLLARAASLPTARLATGFAVLEDASAQLHRCLSLSAAVLTPACPQSAPSIHEDPAKNVAAFVAPANVAGLPAVAWPQRLGAGHTVSLQLIGKFGQDLRLLALASQVQQLLDRELATEPSSG